MDVVTDTSVVIAVITNAAEKDGLVVLRPERTVSAPLDVGGAKVGLQRNQIVAAIRDSRKK